ncbi:MAG: DNA polymerase III subunit delta [Bacteroidota bacterium]
MLSLLFKLKEESSTYNIMLFSEIAGQEEIKRKLIETIREHRVSHNQLYTGPEGSGKLALAIAFGQYLNCASPSETEACGECPSCLKYNKLVHPDLHFVFPVIKNSKNKRDISDNYIAEWREMVIENPYFSYHQWLEKIGAENKQGSIFRDESEEIIRKLSLKTFEAEYKTMIIWLMEKMNVNAANKLLKIFEEPPGNTVFILISEQPDQLLPTILSRTQMVKIPRISARDLSAYLVSKFQIDPDKATSIAYLTDGNCSRASEMAAEADDPDQHFGLFVRFMRLSYSLGYSEMNSFVDEMYGLGRENQKRFLAYSVRMIREYFLLSTGNRSLNRFSRTEELSDEKFSKGFPFMIKVSNVNKIYNELNLAHFHIERNGYAKIIFFDLMVKLNKLLKKAS